MSQQTLVTDQIFFKTAMSRVGQIEASLIALEYAAEQMDITCVEAALAGIRALTASLYAQLESIQKYELTMMEGKS